MRSERIHVSAGIWRNLANCEPPHTDRGSERRYSLFLAEGFLRRGDRTAARSLIGALLETSRARLPERYLPVCPAGRFGQALAVAGALGERPRSWVPTGGSASLGSRQPRDRGRAASQPRRGDLGDSSQTPRWSGMDSNFRFRDAFASPTAPPLPTPPDSPVSGDPSNGRPASRSVCRGWRLLDDTPASRVDRPHIGGSQASRGAEPEVRIQLPPAASPLRTLLAAFWGRVNEPQISQPTANSSCSKTPRSSTAARPGRPAAIRIWWQVFRELTGGRSIRWPKPDLARRTPVYSVENGHSDNVIIADCER